jgi:hypothetical protein
MNRLDAIETISFGDLTSTAMDFLDRAVAAIKVDSTFGPPIYLPSPFRKEAEVSPAPGAPGTAAPSTAVKGKGFDVGRMLKPKITFEMRDGWGKDRSFAPYGDPGPSKWGYIVGGIIGIILLASYGGASIIKDVRR